VRPATTLAPSFGALGADVAAQLAPARGVKRSQLRADWHRYALSWDHRRIIDAGGRHLPARGRGQTGCYAKGLRITFRGQLRPSALKAAVFGSSKKIGSTCSMMSPVTSRKFRLFSKGISARRAPLSIAGAAR